LHCANSKKVKSEKTVVALPFIRERSDKLGHKLIFCKVKNAKKHRKLRRKKTFQKKSKTPRAYVCGCVRACVWVCVGVGVCVCVCAGVFVGVRVSLWQAGLSFWHVILADLCHFGRIFCHFGRPLTILACHYGRGVLSSLSFWQSPPIFAGVVQT